jgi:hypothetical protein
MTSRPLPVCVNVVAANSSAKRSFGTMVTAFRSTKLA